jgi:transposase
MGLFPQSIEDYVPEDAPVRAYDAFIDSLDFTELGIRLDGEKVGNPEYDPVAMLKLLVYGYSYGVRSSRKLEREVHYNLSFIWLVGGLKPDHKTIAEFRRRNKKALTQVLKQCVRMCLKLKLVEGNTLFVDGSKMRADASLRNTWTEERCERHFRKIDRRIEEILEECERVDRREEGMGSLVKMEEELRDQKKLREKMAGIVGELKEEKKKSMNTVDRDCTRVNSVHGSHAGYNAQLVVDGKEGLIVSSDAVGENNDLSQFAKQVERGQEMMGKKCRVACADSGYATTDELKKIDEQDIRVVVPSQRQAEGRNEEQFHRDWFRYEGKRDCYYCRRGRKLVLERICAERHHKVYRIKKAAYCLTCRYFGECTTSKKGRTLRRLIHEETRLKLEAQFKEPFSQRIYNLRQQKVEIPFGHIKRNLGMRAFLLRGRAGVQAEMALAASCFNLRRMITLLGGVKNLIKKLDKVKIAQPALAFVRA